MIDVLGVILVPWWALAASAAAALYTLTLCFRALIGDIAYEHHVQTALDLANEDEHEPTR